MPKRMPRLIMIGLCCCLLLQLGPRAVRAAPDSAEAHQLLEQGLTVYELDREIDRLNEQEKQLNVRLQQTAVQVEQAARLAEQHKQKTERIIRSYYSGERSTILLAALHVRSLRDALYVWEQLRAILESDRRSLDDYRAKVQSLKTAQAELESQRRQLVDTLSAYKAEKEKKLKAQQEVDKLLASNANRAALEKELEQTLSQWEERGLPLFQRYFTALSDVMPKLPEMLGQNNKMVSLKGLSPKVTIGDAELNHFLQTGSSALDGFAFRFGDNVITAGGSTDGVSITLDGRYVVENKPANAVRFVIDRLSFNSFRLPESTVRTVERQFDLSFYPSKLLPFLQATGVTIGGGQMTIDLKIGL